MSSSVKQEPRANNSAEAPERDAAKLDAMAQRLKRAIREVPGEKPAVDPEAGCVAWYQYPTPPKGP